MPLPRRWFQFHLSTAIAMTFVAGGLMRLNIGPRISYISDYRLTDEAYDPVFQKGQILGWPVRFWTVEGVSQSVSNGAFVLVMTGVPTTTPRMRWAILLGDAVIWVAILTLVTLLCETLLYGRIPSRRDHGS